MKNKYEVIIIGAGIGGLVCGCYLAKMGLKVLIVEQHDKPGGYCTSFERQGYRFDVGVHYLGGIKRGVLGKILEELDLKDKIQFNQFDPTDKIIMPNNETYIRVNYQDTIKEFQSSFSKEKRNIEKFFTFIMQKNFFDIYSKVKGKSFGDIVDSFFYTLKFKKMLDGLLWGVIGTTLSEIPAWIGAVIWREFFMDPGYYPVGGIGRLPDALAAEIKKNGGYIHFSQKVIQVLNVHRQIKSILLNNGTLIETKNIIANCDPFQASKLMNKTMQKVVGNISVSPSFSAVVIYLGLRLNLNERLKHDGCIWKFLDWEGKGSFYKINSKENNFTKAMLIFSPSLKDYRLNSSNGSTLQLYTLVPDKTKSFWNKYNIEEIYNQMLLGAEKIIPSLSRYITVKEIATPITFEKFTLNKKGAILGRRIFSNLSANEFLSKSIAIKGVFFTGSWYGYGGVSEAAVSGKRTAEKVLCELGIKNKFNLVKL